MLKSINLFFFPNLRTFCGEGNGNPLQYSCLENPSNRGAWWAAIHGVTQSPTWLKQLSSSSSMYGCDSWTRKMAECQRNDASERCGWRKFLRVPLQGDPTSPSYRKSVLNIHWKDWGWSWNSNTLATWCEDPTHLKRPWCWERLKAEGEGDERGWDGLMASLTQWTRVWANSRR